MKPILFMLAMFLLVFIGQYPEGSGKDTANRNNDYMVSTTAPYRPLALNHRNSGCADPNPGNISPLSLRNVLTDTIQADLSGKHYPLGFIVF